MPGATPAPRFPFQRYGRGRPRRCCCWRPMWILRVPAPSFCSLASMFSVLWLSLSGFPSNLKKTKQNTAFYHPAIQVWYNHGILSGDLGYYFKNTFSVISMGVVAGRDKIAYLAYLLDLTILTPFKYVIFLFEKIFLKIPKMYKSRENSPVNPQEPTNWLRWRTAPVLCSPAHAHRPLWPHLPATGGFEANPTNGMI